MEIRGQYRLQIGWFNCRKRADPEETLLYGTPRLTKVKEEQFHQS